MQEIENARSRGFHRPLQVIHVQLLSVESLVAYQLRALEFCILDHHQLLALAMLAGPAHQMFHLGRRAVPLTLLERHGAIECHLHFLAAQTGIVLLGRNAA